AANGDTLLARPEREPDIDTHGGENHHDIDPAEIIRDEACDHQQLDRGRDRVQHSHAYDGIDAGDTTLDHPVEAASAPLEMKPQRQFVQMAERAVGELPHRVLR